MAGISLSGLASGLDTTSLINSLMAAAAQPQVLLNQQITSSQSTVTALQNLNALFAQLADQTDAFTKSSDLTAFTASVSDNAVATATASSGASSGSIGFTVDALATSQVIVTGAMPSWPTTPPAFTFVASDGTTTSVTANSNSLDAIVSAINGSDAGVVAMKVKAGTDGSGNAQYRLQLSSARSGAAGAFTAYAGTAADVAAGTASDLSSQPGSAVIAGAQDARITLWPGTAAAQTVTSSSNDFADVLPGVDLTVSAVSSSPVTLAVSQDLGTETGTASSLVSAVNSILSMISKGRQTTTTTDPSDGGTDTVFGPFTADSNVRGAGQNLTDALTLDVGGVSPSSIGIQLQKDGTVDFDQDAFQAAMQDDPAGTTALFDTLVGRINAVAGQVSDPFDGTLTGEIDSTNDNISAMQDKSDAMTLLLNQQQATLQQQFAYMETMVSQINSQGSYLQSYFDSLSSSSSSSKK